MLLSRQHLLLLVAPVALAQVAHDGAMCHIACAMDGLTGTCHTDHCGSGNVACCKRGLVQPPCDGVIGCTLHQCCTVVAASAVEAAAVDSSPTSTMEHSASALPLLASSVPPPPDADLAAAATWNDAHHCAMATLGYSSKPATELTGGFQTSSALVSVEPWQEALRVVLLFRSHGQYVEVMDVEGASLLQREQVGPWLRISFVLDDEPAAECPAAPCFTLDTVGELGAPESTACTMPAELIDPPPSPPPRYISRGELAALGQLALAPPPPPPAPPLLSSAAGLSALDGREQASSSYSAAGGPQLQLPSREQQPVPVASSAAAAGARPAASPALPDHSATPRAPSLAAAGASPSDGSGSGLGAVLGFLVVFVGLAAAGLAVAARQGYAIFGLSAGAVRAKLGLGGGRYQGVSAADEGADDDASLVSHAVSHTPGRDEPEHERGARAPEKSAAAARYQLDDYVDDDEAPPSRAAAVRPGSSKAMPAAMEPMAWTEQGNVEEDADEEGELC